MPWYEGPMKMFVVGHAVDRRPIFPTCLTWHEANTGAVSGLSCANRVFPAFTKSNFIPNAKSYIRKNVNNIVCTPNYIRRSHYKVCHGTAWVEISFILFFQLVARRRILFLIDKATLEEIIYNIVCTPNYIRRSGFKVCHGTACVEYISYYFCNRLAYAELS